MDSLGFTDRRDTWSDSIYLDVEALELQLLSSDSTAPATVPVPQKRGRHEAIPEAPDPFDDWAPQPMVRRLERGNTRWTTILSVLLLLTSVATSVYWFGYEQPRVESLRAVQATASAAQELNAQLSAVPPSTASQGWEEVRAGAIEVAARELFETAGALPDKEAEMRRASISASNDALALVSLLNEVNGYRSATNVVLVPPALQTDPELIELDEAARSFGDWQARFESGLSVLRSNEFADVDRRLETLASRLPVALQDYVDALREDDMAGAQAVVDAISGELDGIGLEIETSLETIRARTADLAAEARTALAPLVD